MSCSDVTAHLPCDVAGLGLLFSMISGSKTCNDEVINLKDVVKATVSGGLYQPMNEELIAYFINGSFLIRNKTSDPNIRFRLAKTTSILKAIYPPGRLKLNSLTGNMTYNRTHWIVMVTGELETCPGLSLFYLLSANNFESFDSPSY